MNNEMIETIEIEEPNEDSQIKAVGVGGYGSNLIIGMIEQGVKGVEFICVDADAQSLGRSHAYKAIELRGPGLDTDIRLAIENTHLLFIVAGMGGGTGTSAAPMIARIAKTMGILTVAVVTQPFEFEGSQRIAHASQGLVELQAHVDALIVVPSNQWLKSLGYEVPQSQAIDRSNGVVKNLVAGVALILNEVGDVNVDFEDVRTVMGQPGKAAIGMAIATGPNRGRIAAQQAVTHLILEGINLSDAKGILLLITATKESLKLSEWRTAMRTIRTYAVQELEVHIIFGAVYDQALGDGLRVMVVATGLNA